MPRDRPETVILIGMLILMGILVGAVWVGPWEGEKTQKTQRKGKEPRVSLLPAGAGAGTSNFNSAFVIARPLDVARVAKASRFDHPLGSENGAMTYNAQRFGENRHLGDDLNGIGGWDSDLGDPVHAVASGRVMFAGRPSEGWGNVVIISHRLEGDRLVQTVYGHLEAVHVAVDDRVHRGEVIGKVGKGSGQYLAHLHFEVREAVALNPGAGYADGALDRVSPSAFLAEKRGAPEDLLSSAPVMGRVAEEALGRGIRVRMGVEGEEGKTARELRQ